MPSSRRPFNVLWLQSAGCGGCTMSLLNAEAPGLFETLEGLGIRLLWHPSLSEATGAEARQIIRQAAAGELPLDCLCVEGALLRGPRGTGRFHRLAGTGRSTVDIVRELAGVARYTVAVGTCAAYGGLGGSTGGVTEACGLQYEAADAGGLLGEGYRSAAGLPVVNVAGCPTHPGWVLETLGLLAQDRLAEADLDRLGRPLSYAQHLVHHGCPRNEYYEYKASAGHAGELGCLMEHLGCKGTQAQADCNIRPWNGGGSCLTGGYPCVNCTDPAFHEPGHPFQQTPKVAGIPIGLPTDMPRAWFVALASLSKAATPRRVRENAGHDRVVVPPGEHPTQRRHD